MTLEIDVRTARRLVLARQGLADPPRQRLGVDGLRDLIERLGFVQLDSISTVARAHHMILFARNQTYRPDQLRKLHERDRHLFEHWTDRIAALIPTRFYPYWTHRFERERPRLEQRFQKWFGDDHQALLDQLLDRIRVDGPLKARDLVEGQGRGSSGWWEWHPGKTALEYLWRTGRLAVARRDGFQKVYDLPERVIPTPHREALPDPDGFVDWACRSALERLGFASPGEIAGFWGLITPAEAKAWCRAQPRGAVVPVTVATAEGGEPRSQIARPDIEAVVAALPAPPARLRVLSPFDPVLRDRQRLNRLFGFDYRIEVFVPAAKRRYGYYVFPLLEGDRLIGRIDMKADRDAGDLRVSALWLEPGVKLAKGRQRQMEAELERVRRFAGVDQVRYDDGFLKT